MSAREIVCFGLGWLVACVTIVLGVFLRGPGGYR